MASLTNQRQASEEAAGAAGAAGKNPDTDGLAATRSLIIVFQSMILFYGGGKPKSQLTLKTPMNCPLPCGMTAALGGFLQRCCLQANIL